MTELSHSESKSGRLLHNISQSLP